MIRDVISIVVVNHHMMFLEALVRALAHEPEVEVVGTAMDVTTALTVVRQTSPQVVVLNNQLPDGGGPELARLLQADRPEVALLMLTGAADRGLLDRAMAAGYTGLLTTESSMADLVAAVRAVSAGKTHVPDFDSSRRGGGTCAGGSADLSPRELEAMQLAAQGLANRRIAEAMYLSNHTIKNYMQSAIRKLGAHSKLEAVTIALREGIVTVDPDR